MLKIGEFARLSQTSVKTLRFYDAVALFRPAHVDAESGYRYYAADQVDELGEILHLRALGFRLRQIRALTTEGSDRARLREVLLEKRHEISRRVQDEEIRLAGLNGWLDRLEHQDQVPSNKVTLKRVGSFPIASIRTSIARYSDAVDLFQELTRYTKEIGAPPGPPAAIWHTCGESGRTIDCEAYVPLQRPITANRRVRAYELPAAIIASVVHHGDSATCIASYATARSWIASHGFEVSGPKRELYWRGGLDQDRSSDITEIQFPIRIGTQVLSEAER